MADLLLSFDDATQRADLVVAGNDLATGVAPGGVLAHDDLRTAVILSLFTDRGTAWQDSLEGTPLGSRLYRLRRAKRTQQTLLQARDYCREALAWLVSDGVASSVAVQAAWAGTILEIGITVTQATGPGARFGFVWESA